MIRRFIDGAPAERWVSRILTAAAVWALLVLLLWAADTDPSPIPIAAVVAAVTIAVSLALDLGNTPPPSSWPTTPLAEGQRGGEPRVQRLQRLVEGARSSDGRSEPLRRVLHSVVDDRVATRHGVSHDDAPHRYRDIVGDDLIEWLTAGEPNDPAPPITRRELLGVLHRIEAL